jgi:hypothetical protein
LVILHVEHEGISWFEFLVSTYHVGKKVNWSFSYYTASLTGAKLLESRTLLGLEAVGQILKYLGALREIM